MHQSFVTIVILHSDCGDGLIHICAVLLLCGRHVAPTSQLFYVVSAAMDSFKVTVQDTEMKLSKGDQLMVPIGNTYVFENTSRTKPVKLLFTLVKSATEAS